jgi:hypothetical protein
MDLLPVRTTPEDQLPWSKNSIYRYSSKNRYPEILIKIDGKLFLDLDAFKDLARKKREAQIKKAKAARRGLEA